MTALQARKKELVVASGINRQVLRLEVDYLRVRFDQCRRSLGWAQASWKWAPTLAGFLLARKMSKRAGFLSKASTLLPFLGGLWKAWQSRRERAPER